MTPDEVIDIVKASGLRGCGGAGFPTGVKWQSVRVTVRRATREDLEAVKALADAHRHELGFVPHASLRDALSEHRLFVAVSASSPSCPAPRIVGFVHFRCCRDGHATIYEIAVLPEWRGRGVGKALMAYVIDEARGRGCHTLRLKCPIDSPANGFYARLGFHRIATERGKRRPLAVWEKSIERGTEGEGKAERWSFFVGLTSDASQVQALVRRFAEGYNRHPPFNPFERVIVSPLFVPPATLRLLQQGVLRSASGGQPTWDDGVPPCACVMFDSGGFQVQTGRLDYDELCRKLRKLYEREQWAHLFVLPDHVPTSRDADFEVHRKVDETLRMGELFLRWLPHLSEKTVVGVVHGRTEAQVRLAARHWLQLGVTYIAFGSFGTSGRNGSVNMLSRRSLKVLRALAEEAAGTGLRLHIFGIGNPTYLLRLAEHGITPTSFDSVGWWKAGGFGKVLFPTSRQLHVTRNPLAFLSARDIKRTERHNCPFCTDLAKLQRSRWHRVLHNLVTFVETAQKLSSGGLTRVLFGGRMLWCREVKDFDISK